MLKTELINIQLHLKSLFQALNYKTHLKLSSNKASVIACEVGELPYKNKLMALGVILLSSIGGVGLFLVSVSLLAKNGLDMPCLLVLPCGIILVIFKQLLLLTNPKISYCEGPISKPLDTTDIKCAEKTLKCNKETWLKLEANKNYRVWYSAHSSNLLAFEVLQATTAAETLQTLYINIQPPLNTTKSNIYQFDPNLPSADITGLCYGPPNLSLFNYYNPDPYDQVIPFEDELQELVSIKSVAELTHKLQSYNSQRRFEAYQGWITLGGEGVDLLADMMTDLTNIHRPAIKFLLKAISKHTIIEGNKAMYTLICNRCFFRYRSYTVPIVWHKPIVYYACRKCKQSRNFTITKTTVAVLDETMKAKSNVVEGILRINAFKQKHLFDFNQVEIIEASDEAVERFIVQIANDSDPYRKNYYQYKSCTIASSCNISINNIRILEKIFKTVKQDDFI